MRIILNINQEIVNIAIPAFNANNSSIKFNASTMHSGTINLANNAVFASSINGTSDTQILKQLYKLQSYIAKQYSVATQSLLSEKIAVGTGIWEVAWGLFESLADGIITKVNTVSMGVTISKLAYTATSGEELASASYLVGNHKQYADFLQKQLNTVNSIINKIQSKSSANTSLNQLSQEETQLLNIALNNNFNQAITADMNKEANSVIMVMQIFNALVLGGLSLLLMKKGHDGADARLFKVPNSWIKPVQKVAELKGDIFTAIARPVSKPLGIAINKVQKIGAKTLHSIAPAKHKHLFKIEEPSIEHTSNGKITEKGIEKIGQQLEIATISVPMGVLAVWKFILASKSQDPAFSNTLFAQGISHVACFIGGASQGYQAAFMASDSDIWNTAEKFLTYYEALTYIGSSGKLMNFIIRNPENNSLTTTQ